MSYEAITTTATTIQGQFLEVAIAYKQATTNDQTGNSKVTIDADMMTGLISIQATMFSDVELAGGQITITPTDTQFITIGVGGG